MRNIFYFQWHITDFCGNRCSHCYIDKFNRRYVTTRTATDIIYDMKDCCEELEVMPEIAITGGDPMLHPEIWEILRMAKSLGGRLSVLGNPEQLLVESDIIKRLIDIGLDNYQVSFDGMGKVHDDIRSPGSFDRTTSAINLMLEFGLPVSVMTTVSKKNQFQIIEIMKYAYSLGVRKWSFARYTPDVGECGISGEAYLELMKLVVKEHEPYAKSGIALPMKDPLMRTVIDESIEENRIVGGCGLGSSLLSILPDNTVMACRRHRDSVLGKWKRGGDLLDFFLFHPKMDEYRRIGKIEKCSSCPLCNQCRGCRAAAFAATGNIFGKDPQCVYGD